MFLRIKFRYVYRFVQFTDDEFGNTSLFLQKGIWNFNYFCQNSENNVLKNSYRNL